MSYRNISVNDKNYQYTIGKTHTKIKELGIFLNKDIGVETELNDNKKFVVTPGRIADIISGKPLRPMFSCSHGTVTSEVTSDPYDAEIHNEYSMMINCEKCVHERAMEI